MKIAITGHRPNKLGNDYDLTSPFVQEIEDKIIITWNNIEAEYLAKNKDETNLYVKFITGMALGIDTLFAQIAIRNNIPFIAAIPFKGQDRMWNNTSVQLYHSILKQAASIVIVDQFAVNCTSYEAFKVYHNTPFTSEKMQKRNEWMVDNCDKLIAVWNGSNGGTANCIRYARTKLSEENIHIINI